MSEHLPLSHYEPPDPLLHSTMPLFHPLPLLLYHVEKWIKEREAEKEKKGGRRRRGGGEGGGSFLGWCLTLDIYQLRDWRLKNKSKDHMFLKSYRSV